MCSFIVVLQGINAWNILWVHKQLQGGITTPSTECRKPSLQRIYNSENYTMILILTCWAWIVFMFVLCMFFYCYLKYNADMICVSSSIDKEVHLQISTQDTHMWKGHLRPKSRLAQNGSIWQIVCANSRCLITITDHLSTSFENLEAEMVFERNRSGFDFRG